MCTYFSKTGRYVFRKKYIFKEGLGIGRIFCIWKNIFCNGAYRIYLRKRNISVETKMNIVHKKNTKVESYD